MRRALLAVFLLLGGCAENAVLELQVQIPPAPDPSTETYAQVQVRRADATGFDVSWTGDDPQGVQLGQDAAWVCTSVDSHDATIDLDVRVRFCGSPACDALGDDSAPEVRYHLEHPFYIGHHTYWSAQIAAVPECTTDADCALGRCVDGRCGCETDADCCPAGDCSTCGGDPSGTPCPVCEGEPASCVVQVDRCHVEGCIPGRTNNFCASDGRHFCESNGIDRTEAYMCRE
jgi:hypothetical protein